MLTSHDVPGGISASLQAPTTPPTPKPRGTSRQRTARGDGTAADGQPPFGITQPETTSASSNQNTTTLRRSARKKSEPPIDYGLGFRTGVRSSPSLLATTTTTTTTSSPSKRNPFNSGAIAESYHSAPPPPPAAPFFSSSGVRGGISSSRGSINNPFAPSSAQSHHFPSSFDPFSNSGGGGGQSDECIAFEEQEEERQRMRMRMENEISPSVIGSSYPSGMGMADEEDDELLADENMPWEREAMMMSSRNSNPFNDVPDMACSTSIPSSPTRRLSPRHTSSGVPFAVSLSPIRAAASVDVRMNDIPPEASTSAPIVAALPSAELNLSQSPPRKPLARSSMTSRPTPLRQVFTAQRTPSPSHPSSSNPHVSSPQKEQAENTASRPGSSMAVRALLGRRGVLTDSTHQNRIPYTPSRLEAALNFFGLKTPSKLRYDMVEQCDENMRMNAPSNIVFCEQEEIFVEKTLFIRIMDKLMAYHIFQYLSVAVRAVFSLFRSILGRVFGVIWMGLSFLLTPICRSVVAVSAFIISFLFTRVLVGRRGVYIFAAFTAVAAIYMGYTKYQTQESTGLFHGITKASNMWSFCSIYDLTEVNKAIKSTDHDTSSLLSRIGKLEGLLSSVNQRFKSVSSSDSKESDILGRLDHLKALQEKQLMEIAALQKQSGMQDAKVEHLESQFASIMAQKDKTAHTMSHLESELQRIRLSVQKVQERAGDVSSSSMQQEMRRQLLELVHEVLEESLPRLIPARVSNGKLEVAPEFLMYLAEQFVSKESLAQELIYVHRSSSTDGDAVRQLRLAEWQEFLAANTDKLQTFVSNMMSDQQTKGSFLTKDQMIHMLDARLMQEDSPFMLHVRSISDSVQTQSETLQSLVMAQSSSSPRSSSEVPVEEHRQLLEQVLLSDVRPLVNSMIRSALDKYAADVLAKPDYALASAGARILPRLTSPTFSADFRIPAIQRVASLMGIKLSAAKGPKTALHPDTHPGNCWAMSGTRGILGIQLSRPVLPTDFTLEHAPESVLPPGSTTSAPRHIEVWGLLDGSIADQETFLALELEDVKVRSGASGGSSALLLAAHEFTPAGGAIQTFPMQQSVYTALSERSMVLPVIVIRVLDNWGHSDWTCLYRVRVHA